MADTPKNAIAIIGLGGRFPGARSIDEFWQNVVNGVEALDDFTDAELDAAFVERAQYSHPSYVRRGTILEDADTFDAGFFGFSPREAQLLDPQQRIFLESTWEAMENAGYAGSVAGQSVGVYAGVGLNTYVLTQLLRNPPFLAAVGGYQMMVANDKDFLATRVAYKLDLRGPSLTIQTACSTSLVAVQLACRALQHGECDMAIAGGSAIVFPQRGGYMFQEGMILSPDGHCRPFDAKAKGTRPGAGAGVVVLKRLADAIADRDTIRAVILGSAVNNDGSGKAGYTAPSVEGQVEVIATAQALAGVDPRTVTYVEAHGTGTPLGDPIEIAALTQAFRGSTKDVGFCRIGSLKANIGHLDAAAGVASLIKAVLALEHAQIPPLVHFDTPNPELHLETSPFTAAATAAPWTPYPDTETGRRRAGVSSFGIGGTNAHVVIEEAPPAAKSTTHRDAHLLVLSARTPAAVDRATADLAAHLEAHPAVAIGDVAWTLQVGRQTFSQRRAAVVTSIEHAARILGSPGPGLLQGAHDGAARPVAFMFSGQGSQHPGMGAGLYGAEPVYKEAFDRCAGILERSSGSTSALDVRKIVFGAEAEGQVNETRFTQPLLFVTEYALAKLWMSWGITPSAMLGHSIGEYVAAHLAGVFSLEDALAIVAARGRLMQELPAGSMAAVHLAGAELERLLPAGVEIAARNAPALSTVSGKSAAITAFLAELGPKGVDSRALHTSHAFHSAMMEPALAPFIEIVRKAKLSPPTIPYASNLTGTWIKPEEATSPEYWAKHLRHAVLFEAGVKTITADPSMLVLEVGPGNALTTLARLSLGSGGAKRVFASLGHPRDRRADVEATLEAAGRLWLAGAELDWNGLRGADTVRRVGLPTYPFERQRYWVDAVNGPAPTTATTNGAGPGLLPAAGAVFAPTWIRDDSLEPGEPRLQGVWLALASPGPLWGAVSRRLRDAGADVVLVEPGDRFVRVEDRHFVVRPDAEEDLVAVVRAIDGARLAGAIHLWAISGSPAPTSRGLAFTSLITVAAGLDASSGPRPLRLIGGTSGAVSVLGEPVVHHAAALAFGPLLALPAEVPGLQTRLVDLEVGDLEAAADAIVREAAATDDERVVAHRGTRRWARRYDAYRPAAAELVAVLPPGGVVLVTGGLGGLGLALARSLAASASAKLVLTSRTADADRATAAIRDIEKAGGEALVHAADASDEVAMRAAIEAALARWGRIDAVIHSAGVPGTGTLAFRKTPEEIEACLAPKLGGLEVLVKLLGNAPLSFVALMSSIDAVIGAAGTSDYAAANAVLDAFVDSAARPSRWAKVFSLSWGPWRDIGMAAKRITDTHTEYLALTPAEGIDAFARVLASGRRRAVVVPYDLRDAMAKLAALAHAADRPATEAHAAPRAAVTPAVVAAAPRPQLSTAFVPAETDTEKKLAAIWSELLGVDPIGIHDDFFELGGHSLLATRILARIDELIGVRLTLRNIFEGPTIHRLSQRADEGRAPSTVIAADREEVEF